MGKTKRSRHVRVQFMGQLPEVIEVFSGKGDRLHLIGRSSFLFGWREVH
jgi:hypothetical protein